MNQKVTMKEIPSADRPYEKCEKLGAGALSDTELLAVLLRTGTRGENALELASRILYHNGESGILGIHQFSIERLKNISKGTVNASLITPRELFIEALQKNAVFVIILHNHPSGEPTPSREDRLITRRIQDAGALIGIELLDHIIIGNNCYVSFREEGML